MNKINKRIKNFNEITKTKVEKYYMIKHQNLLLFLLCVNNIDVLLCVNKCVLHHFITNITK